MIYLEDFSTTKQSTAMTVATTTAIVTHSLMPTPLPVVKDGNCYEKLKLLNTKLWKKFWGTIQQVIFRFIFKLYGKVLLESSIQVAITTKIYQDLVSISKGWMEYLLKK